MSIYLFIIRTFGQLRVHRPGKLLTIFGLTFFTGITSGFSIVLLIPLLQLLNVGYSQNVGGIALFFKGLSDKTGINLSITSILFIYAFLFITGALMQYWKSVLDAGYQQSFIYQLRSRLFRKIILTDWPLLNNKSKTSHMQILAKEIPNTSVYYIYYLRLVTALIMTFIYVIYSMLVSAEFTIIITSAGILLFFLLRKYLFKAFHLGETFVESYSRLYKYIDDFWQTVKIAKVHNSEEFYYNKFDEASNSLLDMELKMQKNWSLPQLIYRVTGILVLVSIVWIGYVSGYKEVSSFFILILLFSRIFPQFVAITSDVNMLFSNVASVKLVMELDNELSDNRFDQTTSQNRIHPEKEIKLENLKFSWPDGETLFNDFSEIIKAKAITGIIGASGRGKTTLIDLIAGLEKPGEGRILVDDRPLDYDLLPSWKSSIGYLPQDSFFVDGTLRENLVWDTNISVADSEIWKVLEQVNAVNFLSRFIEGLDTFIVNYPFSFSGGERQRLALARVLLRRPGVLLLDEATSSLDSENEVLIMEVIEKLKSSVTIIFVTHRTSLLSWFDKVIEL